MPFGNSMTRLLRVLAGAVTIFVSGLCLAQVKPRPSADNLWWVSQDDSPLVMSGTEGRSLVFDVRGDRTLVGYAVGCVLPVQARLSVAKVVYRTKLRNVTPGLWLLVTRTMFDVAYEACGKLNAKL